jgi:hypothetical protein
MDVGSLIVGLECPRRDVLPNHERRTGVPNEAVCSLFLIRVQGNFVAHSVVTAGGLIPAATRNTLL